jgi:S1-C subfamily serine protease
LIRPLSLLALPLVAAAVLSACTGGNSNTSDPTPATTAEPASLNTGSIPAGSTIDLVRRLTPSVVHIASEAATTDVFGQLVPQRGVGTGFIIDGDGRIVTNNHVVEIDGQAAQRITVTLSDGRQFPARIVGRDQATDVAVLKIDADGLSPVKLGSSAALMVGQDVVAIGNALDLPGGPTVTRGVVSAVNRVIQEGGVSIPDAIQTDAAINPGNSGGPLLNMSGEVVGITTAVIRGNAEGIGLAISIDSAKPIVDELIANGKIDRGLLGVNISPITPSAAQTCGIEETVGILLSRVDSSAPAGKAGLRACDVLQKLSSVELRSTGDLFRALTKHRAGETVEVSYLRDGDEKTAEVTLG